jgi:glycosyltransferase involved in cell wall biosynthesis
MTGEFQRDPGRARPRVSVVIIFLNAERFIEEAIHSVLAQTCKDFEIILVDDGSAEACSRLARQYESRYHPTIRYTDHEEHRNRGMSASRNAGIKLALGEYIAFLDADDVWSPTKLSEQLDIMDNNPQVGMVCGATRYWHSWDGGGDYIVPSGHVQDEIVFPPDASLRVYPLGAAAAPCPSDLLIRRSVVEKVGGFEEHFTGAKQMYEDQGFLAKLYLAAPVWFSSAVWLDYRQHGDSCVAQVHKKGLYGDVRRYFLAWLTQYVRDKKEVDFRVKSAIYKARLRNHILTDKIGNSLKRALKWVGRRTNSLER